jgi:hypothetical protein
MLQSLKSSLLRTGYLTRQQLAAAEEYREEVGCSLPRALWSLRVMHPDKFADLCRQILDRPKLRDWLLKHPLDLELPWLVEPGDLIPVRFLPCGWLNPQTVVVAPEEPGYPGVWQAVKRLCPGVEKNLGDPGHRKADPDSYPRTQAFCRTAGQSSHSGAVAAGSGDPPPHRIQPGAGADPAELPLHP